MIEDIPSDNQVLVPFVPASDEFAQLILKHDWSRTALGSPLTWPRCLLGYISMVLQTPTPAIIFWGEHQVQIYNKGYATIMGPRHPRYFGSTYQECWPDTYPLLYPEMQKVLAGGTFEVDNAHIMVTRQGFHEEAYFTFPFLPLRDDQGRIAGILQHVIENTKTVLSERRNKTLRGLAPTSLLEGEAVKNIESALKENVYDIPFALTWVEDEAHKLKLVSRVNIQSDLEATAELQALISHVYATGTTRLIEDLPSFIQHHSVWPEPTARAIALPLIHLQQIKGVILLGISPRLEFEAEYRSFFKAIADAISLNLVSEHESVSRHKTENELSLALEGADMGTWRWYVERGDLFWSEVLVRQFGYAPGEFGGTIESFRSRLHPEDRDRAINTLNSAIEKREVYECEYRIQQPRGGIRWIYSRGRGSYDPDGQCLHVTGITVDITERKLAQEQIKQQEQRFRKLTNAVPQLIWTATPEGVPTFVNQNWIDYTGFKIGNETPQWTWSDVIHPDDFAYVNELWENAKKTGEHYSAEYRLRRQDGSYHWHLRRANVTRDDKGEIKEWIGTCTEIEDQKRLQAILQDTSAELEREVAARTIELTEANSALVASNQELEAFSYSVSHDLRAPLRGIDGFSQALLEDYGSRLDETGRKYLNYVRQGTQRMGILIDDMLTLSRLTRAEIRKEPIDLSSIAESIVANLRRQDPSRRVNVEISPQMTASADPHLMEAVLENLLGNAWKFTSKREIGQITFTCENRDDETIYVLRDNGAGFDMEYADKLFQAFQRLHSNEEFKGTGIGLATVRRVITRHGGRVWAEGHVNAGSTFYFTL